MHLANAIKARKRGGEVSPRLKLNKKKDRERGREGERKRVLRDSQNRLKECHVIVLSQNAKKEF